MGEVKRGEEGGKGEERGGVLVGGGGEGRRGKVRESMGPTPS